MADALDAMATHGLATEQGRAADQRFHSLVIEAARNQLLSTLSSSIMAAVAWTTIFKQRRRALPRDPMPEHRALHPAIVSGDAEAPRADMVVLIDHPLHAPPSTLPADDPDTNSTKATRHSPELNTLDSKYHSSTPTP